MKAKLVVVLVGLVAAVLLVTRYAALSSAGVPSGWMLYLGLPITAAGVAFALRLLDVGAGWGAYAADVQRAERLQELDDLRARGAISDSEYTARRLHIIAEM